MSLALRKAAAPVYLLLCLLLGGSAQGIWTNALLQMIGLGIIAWAAGSRFEPPMAKQPRVLLWIALFGLAIVVVQLIPLPSTLWSHLGGRSQIAADYGILGLKPPPMPISLAPYSSIATLLAVIPAIAMFCAIVRLQAYRTSWLAIALVAGLFGGVLLGALQVASAAPESSPWYLYPQSSFGFATGFFANANHMATLLVISLPFLAALLVSSRGASMQRYSAAAALVGGAVLVIIVGLALNKSLAGYGLAIAVIAASVAIVLPARKGLQRWALVAAVALLMAGMVGLVLSPVGERNLEGRSSVGSRGEILATTAEAIKDFMPLGSGLGTFRPVYQLYEDRDRVTATTMPHAHNDYAELVLELGLPGAVLILLFLLWWAASAARAWGAGDSTPFARAAAVASAAILVHSIVDFPLRTAAISACFAMCLALLAERRTQRGGEKSELWPTRHMTF